MKNSYTRRFRGSKTWSIFLLASVFAGASGQTSHTVDVTSNIYTPAEITIQAGDTVIWTNSQGRHNVNGQQSAFPDNPESFGNSVGRDWVFSHVFTMPGTYDYQCDPHISFNMFGKVHVLAPPPDTLTMNFSGMTPHVGQTIWLSLSDENENLEVSRLSEVISESFSLVLPAINSGGSYLVEFFADHNGNGSYDAPPVDHAWRLELENTDGNEVLDFSHNTNFTDIEWEHKVFLNLSGMAPHVGQEGYFLLRDGETGEVIDRRSEDITEEFTVELGEIMAGNPYHVEFFADHNGNGHYDAPPSDHAWRIEIASAMGDEIVDFSHNTDFTDVDWQHRLRISFSGMTPHVGQMLTAFITDFESRERLDTVVLVAVPGADFELESYGIEPGRSYVVDLYADHNGNGMYDLPPMDHAWRIETGVVMGDTEIEFAHNTDFTDINKPLVPTLTVNLSGMTPHVGQQGWILLTDLDTGEEIERGGGTVEESFPLAFEEITPGHSFLLDLWVDHNGNGYYDAPPVDHAWRIEILEAGDNEMVDFMHNTDFTDVEWEHRAILSLEGMTPHMGQEIYFALIETGSGEIVDRISETVEEEFSVELGELMPGKSYSLDFFTDHNDNGSYDAPPADHAWRLEISNAAGDDSLNFVHNTDFTDIMWKQRLRVRFSGMAPHVGQMLTLFVRDLATGTYLDTVTVSNLEEEFDVISYVIQPGGTYMIDIYADHNGNGTYDAPPVDHAWRIETGTATGDLDVEFVHNTSFTDIFTTTGIDNAGFPEGLRVYPNPVKEILHIRSDHEVSSVSVLSLAGAEIFSANGSGAEITLSLGMLEHGLYLLEVGRKDMPVQVIKLLKQ